MILQSDKTSDNFSDRAILKNLGKWLGMQTVAKNRPILHVVRICPLHVLHDIKCHLFCQDMSIKDLLLEGYYRGGQVHVYCMLLIITLLILFIVGFAICSSICC